MSRAILPPVSPYQGIRDSDAYGSGHFGAPRTKEGSSYSHRGLDFLGAPGNAVLVPIGSTITRIGTAYADPDAHLCSIHLQGTAFELKLLYVNPAHKVGTQLARGDVLGFLQDVAGYHMRKHPLPEGGIMQNHCHLELYQAGDLLDPTPYILLETQT